MTFDRTPHHVYVTIAIVLALIIGLGVCGALYELNRIERNVDKSAVASAETLAMVNQALKGQHKNGDDGYLALVKLLLEESTKTVEAAKKTLQATDKIATAQESRANSLADASVALVNAGQVSVTKLGTSIDELNGVVGAVKADTLPKLNTGIDSLNGLVSALQPTASASTTALNAFTDDLGALKATIDTANTLLANPDLPAITHNFAMSSEQLTLILTHWNGISGDAQTYLHNLENPSKPTFRQALEMTALKVVAQSAVGPIIEHFLPLGVAISGSVPVTVTPSKPATKTPSK